MVYLKLISIMIVKCGPALRLICLLAILCACDSAHALSLPLSDLTPYYAMTPEISDREDTAKEKDVQLHTWWDNDLRAALCPDNHRYWDVDIKCTDNDGVYLSIGHCLTYENRNGENVLYEFKCPYFSLKDIKSVILNQAISNYHTTSLSLMTTCVGP